MSEPNIIKESSSDEEETIATINTGPSARPSSPESQCSICLDELTNPSHTDSCLHSFCFECIRQWSLREDFCPLCHATFHCIYHSLDAMGVYKTHHVHLMCSIEISSEDDSDESDGTSFNILESMYYNSLQPMLGQVRRTRVYSNNWWAEPLQHTTGRIRDISPDFYRNHPFELSRLHTFILRDIAAIRDCLGLENQAMPAVRETYITMARSVMQSLLNCDIRQLYTIHNITSYLDGHAVHFGHELYNYAISQFGIIQYDANFLHIYRLSATETRELLPVYNIVQNLENEEVQRPMIDINVRCNTNDSDDVNHSCFIPNSASVDRPSTSTGIQDSLNQPNNGNNDSDVVIIKHIIRPTEPLNSASVDQPSTSTGIRDSLNQPNNSNNDSDVVFIKHIIRPTEPLNSASVDQPSTSTGIRDSLNQPSSSFQSVDVGSSSYLSRIRRERWNSDSSSDDEDSMIAIRGSKTARKKSQDIINKNKKKRKCIEKKEINTKIPNNNGNCSNLESSSTSGETDTN